VRQNAIAVTKPTFGVVLIMNGLTESFPDFVPQLNVDVQDEDGSTLGFIAVDRVVRGRCSGGIRMTHDLTRAEVRGLANAMSWKFAFMNLPVGGAKSGIICPADANIKEKQRRLALFGKKIGPLLRTFYSSGGDIGVGPDELAIVKHAAGLSTRARPGSRQSGYFTAFGVCTTITAWLEAAGIESIEATAIIEGYGSVSQPLARLLEDAGVRVTGISTVAGGLFNEAGIDLDALDALKDEHGDACVLHYTNGTCLSPSELLQQKTTVLVPGARPWAIHQDNAGQLKCDVIIPASNIPITPEATVLLEKAGVVVIPEFVSNSGGTFGGGIVNQGFSDTEAEKLMQRVYSARLQGLLGRVEADTVPLRTMAERIAEENRERLETNANSRLATLSAAIGRGHSLRRLSSRIALSVFGIVYRLFGDSVQHLPTALHAAAGEAIYNRAVSESFHLD
jgi:glutamate dehydrogenase/leucine dehydrogenase